MNTKTWVVAVVLGGGLAGACLETRAVLDPDHCNSNDGDIFCAEKYPDGSLPFCRLGNEACSKAAGITDLEIDGCFAERPEDECYSACGKGRSVLDDPDCEGVADAGGSSSGPSSTETTPGPTMTGDPTTDDGTDTSPTTDDTTEGPGCQDDADCSDPAMPFCDGAGACVDCDSTLDGNAACANADSANPVCNDGVCVQCTAAESDACGGQTPICNDTENACQACTEHSECPDSACHLDGADAGGCFDEGDVQEASNTAQLESAFTGASADDDVVIHLTGTNYANVSIDFVTNAEVALLGDGSQDISGNTSGGIISTGSSAIVYFAGVSVAGNISGDGIACSGTSIWLDDSEVRNNAQVGIDASGGCAVHLRRSIVAVNNAGGVDVAGGELHVQSSVVGRNGDEFSSTLGGIAIDGTTVDITYSTIAINEALTVARGSVSCGGGESGSIRNSIIVAGGNTVDGCAAALFANNAVDDTGLGGSNTNVGSVSASWFSNIGANDFGLTGTGETVLMDIAMWQDGDPANDFEGDPIATDMPSFPGYDQP